MFRPGREAPFFKSDIPSVSTLTLRQRVRKKEAGSEASSLPNKVFPAQEELRFMEATTIGRKFPAGNEKQMEVRDSLRMPGQGGSEPSKRRPAWSFLAGEDTRHTGCGGHRKPHLPRDPDLPSRRSGHILSHTDLSQSRGLRTAGQT